MIKFNHKKNSGDNMNCGICGTELKDDELGICDNCKASIIHTDDMIN